MDLCAGHPQPSQCSDRFDLPFIGSVGLSQRCRGAIKQSGHPLGARPGHPLDRDAVADSGRLGVQAYVEGGGPAREGYISSDSAMMNAKATSETAVSITDQDLNV
jgi:hypothetical protein